MKHNYKVGDKYGRLEIIGSASTYDWVSPEGKLFRRKKVTVMCECGNIFSVVFFSLVRGTTKSCGCLQKEIMSNGKFATKHNLSKHKLYSVWVAMYSRCGDPEATGYDNYGGRGIKVCPEWLFSFKTFYDWGIANGYQKGLDLDRINNDGDYEPSNCRWVARKENLANRSITLFVLYDGIQITLMQACEKTGLNYHTVYSKVRKGHSTQEAFNYYLNHKS